jgi:hypothetical protein
MRGAIPPLAQYAFMAWCLVKEKGQPYLLPAWKISVELKGWKPLWKEMNLRYVGVDNRIIIGVNNIGCEDVNWAEYNDWIL